MNEQQNTVWVNNTLHFIQPVEIEATRLFNWKGAVAFAVVAIAATYAATKAQEKRENKAWRWLQKKPKRK